MLVLVRGSRKKYFLQGDKLIPTIHQICLANASCGGGIIVILTITDKEQLEHTIRDANLNMQGTGGLIVMSGMSHSVLIATARINYSN